MGTFKKKFGDILLMVSWREISHKYFGKPASWIYSKIDGTDDENPDSEFTEEEISTLRSSLYDIADCISSVADEL